MFARSAIARFWALFKGMEQTSFFETRPVRPSSRGTGAWAPSKSATLSKECLFPFPRSVCPAKETLPTFPFSSACLFWRVLVMPGGLGGAGGEEGVGAEGEGGEVVGGEPRDSL